MATPERQLSSVTLSSAAALGSLVIPGSGQFLLGRRMRGGMVLLTAAASAFVIQWSLVNMKIGQVSLGGWATSWLWAPLILFWAWNAWDAREVSRGRSASSLPAIALAAIILYVIAWQATDIKLDRLVTRFNDAKLIFNDLAHPDVAVTFVNGQEQDCSWDCLFGHLGAKLAGRTPASPIKASENLLDIFGRVKAQEPPAWMVTLGLAQKTQPVNAYIAGTMIETIAIGLMATLLSTILAFPVSFLAAHNIMSRVPGGNAIYYLARLFLNIVRAVDPVVWGLIVIVWVGLGKFAGVIALTIHSMAALGKLLSEEVEHIDPGPVEALTASGANLFQTIQYGVIPQVTPSFLAYTLLRWDINMRSATTVGFVAGGGMGFFVVQAIRMGGYQQYATALWAVAVVIILVDLISAKWRESILKDQPAEPAKRPFLSKASRVAYGLLGVALLIYCWNLTGISIKDLFQPAPTFLRLVGDFLRMDLSGDVVNVVLREMLVTIFQALLATTFGAAVALPFSFLAARNLAGHNPVMMGLYYVTRSLFNVLRSIEALLYAAIFVAWVGIGPFAGMLALAITTFALIGKLFSEAIENIESGPIEAVTATGANPLQVIAYAVLPQIVPPFVSYLIYQWDINIRMATIIGFAGGGGIGLTLSTFFGSLQYHKAGTVVLFIVVVVALMDFASAKLRETLV